MLAGPQLRCSLDFAEMLAAELAGLDDSVRGGAGGEGDVEASRLVCALLVLARGDAASRAAALFPLLRERRRQGEAGQWKKGAPRAPKAAAVQMVLHASAAVDGVLRCGAEVEAEESTASQGAAEVDVQLGELEMPTLAYMAAVAVESFAVADADGEGALTARQFEHFCRLCAAGWVERASVAAGAKLDSAGDGSDAADGAHSPFELPPTAAEDSLELLQATSSPGAAHWSDSQASRAKGGGEADIEAAADIGGMNVDTLALQRLVNSMGARYFVLNAGRLLMVFAMLLGNASLVVWLIIEKATSLPVALGIIAGCNAGASAVLIIAASRYLDAADAPLQHLTDQPWEQVVSQAVGNVARSTVGGSQGGSAAPSGSVAADSINQQLRSLASPDVLSVLRNVVGGNGQGGSDNDSGLDGGRARAADTKRAEGGAGRGLHQRSRSFSIGTTGSGDKPSIQSPLQTAAANIFSELAGRRSPDPGIPARRQAGHRRARSDLTVLGDIGSERRQRGMTLPSQLVTPHNATHRRVGSSGTPRVSFNTAAMLASNNPELPV